MKEKVNVSDYAQLITDALSHGVLLNTSGEKHNAMVIGWGGLGTCWAVPTFTVYVREHRYTKAQLDKTGAFTVSFPLGKPDAAITRICGGKSGNNIDKVAEAGLTLEEADVNGVPGVKEYPLTLECRVLYSQRQDLSRLPKEIFETMYPQDVDGSNPMANRDPHTAYIGEITDKVRGGVFSINRDLAEMPSVEEEAVPWISNASKVKWFFALTELEARLFLKWHRENE